MKTIKWVADEAARKVGVPENLTGGVVDSVPGVGRVVRFSETVQGKKVCLRVDSRPELAAEISRLKAEEITEAEDRKNAEKETLAAAMASGEAFRTVEIAAQYGCELHFARRSKPGEGYAECVIFGFSGSPRVEVEEKAVRQVIGDRNPCGSFPGCSNSAWEISAEEWDKIIELSAAAKSQKAESRKRFELDEAAELQRKIGNGFCFSCGSYCYGDCGHYSTSPEIKFRRDLNQAVKEQNYGIND